MSKNKLISEFNGPIISHYRSCTLCEAMCGIEIKVQGKQILSIKGDEKDPFSRGYICPKATALQDLHEDPERVRTPLQRTPEGWQEISWDKAYGIVIDKLTQIQSQYGNDAVGTYLGNPNAHNMGSLLIGRKFFQLLRTKNKYSATSVDQLPHHIVCYQLFGHQLFIPVPDVDRTQYFMIIGGNPLASNGSIMTVPDIKNRLKDIQQRGGKVVVLDPRRSETAEVATEHYFIKPGSDVLLLLAMINTLYRENLVNPGALAGYTPALEKIKDYVAPYPPERVADKTGISAAQIVRLTREFANAKQAVLYGRMGVSVQAFGTLSQYFIMLINILTGRLDQVGGLMFTSPAANLLPQASKGYFGKQKSRVRQLPSFNGEYPVAALAEEILTPGKGQIKAMVVAAGNPVISCPNGTQMDTAFSSLDFMLAIDFYINETTRHADIILPPVGPLERDHYDLVFHQLAVRNTAKYSPALFPAPGKAKQDWQIYLDLAARLQKKPKLLNKAMDLAVQTLGPSVLVDFLLRTGEYGGKFNLLKGLSIRALKNSPHGVDLGPLKPVLPKALFHKDKKINLAFDFFMPDLARVEAAFFSAQEAAASTEVAQELTLQLIGRRHVRSNNSWMHNCNRLVKGKSRCTALINPVDAEALGITESRLIKVSSRVGSVEIMPEISADIMPGVISIPHGWGHHRAGTRWHIAEQHAGVSVNDLTDDMSIDELSGNAALNGGRVTVCLADTSEAEYVENVQEMTA